MVVSVSVRLEAIRKGSEELRGDVAERPDIELLLNQLTTLGKNSVTMIADMGLKRNTLQLRLETGKESQLQLRIVSVASGRVSVNGELVDSQTLLDAGDVVSLHAPERAYDYKVVVVEPSPPVAATALAVPQPATAAVANLQHIAEEFTCAVCLELQVQATTLVPCGHSFCKACVGHGVCSICSSRVAATVSCRALDNVIATLVSAGQVFSPDDVQVYQERMQSAVGTANSRSSPPLRAAKKKQTTKKRKSLSAYQVSSVGSVVAGASSADAISIID